MPNSKKSTFKKAMYQFSANVDIHNPKDAWGKFYSYVWRKYFPGAATIGPDALTLRLKDEMEDYNGSLHYHGNSPWYYVVFDSEKDYIWFVMKWS